MDNKKCSKCNKIKSLTEFHKAKRNSDGHSGWCKVCTRQYHSLPINKDRRKQKAYHLLPKYINKRIVRKCKDKIREKKYRSTSEFKRKQKVYNQVNRKQRNAHAAKYRAKKLNATLSGFDEEIKQIYQNCPKGYHVDHVIPLQGQTVSGLHVPWNLQYLPAKVNLSKGNKILKEVIDDIL